MLLFRLPSFVPLLSSPPPQVKDALVQELQQKAEETELLHMELQMLETERVRLSLVEDKLVDVLQLLQQLRDLVSQRDVLYSLLYSIRCIGLCCMALYCFIRKV